MKKIFLVILFLGTSAWARGAASGPSNFRYDVSAASGNYNGYTYSEIMAGLNWQFAEWLTWRNAIFHRFGSYIDELTGLDSSLRVGNYFISDGGDLGFNFYAGPGLRFASSNSNGVFGEAGIGFKLAGIYLGVGAKSIYYTQSRTDSSGYDLPKNDNQVFLVLGGGGAF